MLALPERLHLGWTLCPTLGAALLLLIVQQGRKLFDHQTATIAVFLAVLSPCFLANCIGYMSHVSCAVLLVGASLLYLQGLNTSSKWRLSGSFGLLVYSCLTRPLTGVAILCVFVLFGLLYARGSRLRMIVVCMGVTSLLLAIGLTLIDNRVYTGGYWLSPYAWSRGLKVPTEITLDPRLMLQNLLVITRWSIEGTVLYTFPFAFLLSVYTVIHDWKMQPVKLLAVLLPAIVIAHLVQTEASASRIGERYYFEAVFALVLLAARGLILLMERWRPSRQAILTVVLGLASVQLLHQMFAANSILQWTYPYRASAKQVDGLPKRPYLVFLHRCQ